MINAALSVLYLTYATMLTCTMTLHGTVWHGIARYGTVRYVMIGHNMTWRDVT